jgi:Icc-related predicted phosphoesterase
MDNSKFYFVSDLHLEFNPSVKKLLESFPQAEILIIAGDICPVYKDKGKRLKEFLLYAKDKYKTIIFIAGNHEYYGCEYKRDEVVEILKKISEETKTHFLHREKKIINDIEFIGATLWSRIEDRAIYQIADFRSGVFKTKEDYIKEYIYDSDFLRNTLEEKSENTRIVITHHLPTYHLIHKRFQNSLVNSAFFTERLYTFNLNNVKYWICGHTHEYAKFRKDNTLLIVNPVGYKDEQKVTKLSLETYS